MAMWFGASALMEKARAQALQSRWIDDAAVLMSPPWFLAVAFALLAAPSDWTRAAFVSGAVFLMIAARKGSGALTCAGAAAARSSRGRDRITPRMENSMRTRVGLWIDHRKAVLVTVAGEGVETRLVRSDIEKQLRPYGGLPSKAPYGPQDAPPDDLRERAFTRKLNGYFHRVISSIGDAESILIFGPGEAKRELKKRIEGSRTTGHIVGVETADKMTDRQIVANVRRRFQLPGREPRLNRRGRFAAESRASRHRRPAHKRGLSSGVAPAGIGGPSRKRAGGAAVFDEGFSRWEGEGGPALL